MDLIVDNLISMGGIIIALCSLVQMLANMVLIT